MKTINWYGVLKLHNIVRATLIPMFYYPMRFTKLNFFEAKIFAILLQLVLVPLYRLALLNCGVLVQAVLVHLAFRIQQFEYRTRHFVSNGPAMLVQSNYWEHRMTMLLLSPWYVGYLLHNILPEQHCICLGSKE